jgi:hypothetical protein
MSRRFNERKRISTLAGEKEREFSEDTPVQSGAAAPAPAFIRKSGDPRKRTDFYELAFNE